MSYGKYVADEDELGGKYIVWSPKSGLPPKMVYDDRPSAIKVAHIMARKDPSSRFTVCKIVGEAKVAKVEYEDFDKENG